MCSLLVFCWSSKNRQDGQNPRQTSLVNTQIQSVRSVHSMHNFWNLRRYTHVFLFYHTQSSHSFPRRNIPISAKESEVQDTWNSLKRTSHVFDHQFPPTHKSRSRFGFFVTQVWHWRFAACLNGWMASSPKVHCSCPVQSNTEMQNVGLKRSLPKAQSKNQTEAIQSDDNVSVTKGMIS